MKIESAIRELKNGKAAGESGMLPELVKASGPPLKICTCELAAVCVERGMCAKGLCSLQSCANTKEG